MFLRSVHTTQMHNMELRLFLVAFIVSTGLIPVKPNNEVDGDSRGIRENFLNLFDSINKKDAPKTDTYRNILELKTAQEQQGFNAMKETWWSRRQRTASEPRNLDHRSGDSHGKPAAFKREASKKPDPRILPPTHESSLRTLHENNRIIVDKTYYLTLMLESNERFFFLSRPRGFGKTLLVDVMNEYFNGASELFENTYIAQYVKERKSNQWPKNPVIRLDFTDGISTENADRFRLDVVRALVKIAKSYKLDCINEDDDMVRALNKLINTLCHTEYSQEVVLLVDEYDVPYTEPYGRPDYTEMYKTLQDFFRVIKANNARIHFFFYTGSRAICLNNDCFSTTMTAEDISLTPEYSAILGFTEKDLNADFHFAIQNVTKVQKMNYEDTREEMRRYFHGYQFGGTGSEKVYNPRSVITYLAREGTEKISLSKSGGLSTMFLKDKFLEVPYAAFKGVLRSANLGGLRHPIDGNESSEIVSPSLTVRKSDLSGFIDAREKSEVALIAILFHGGYLTIDEEFEGWLQPNYCLRFVNAEVQIDYMHQLSDLLLANTMENYTLDLRALTIAFEGYEWDEFFGKLNALLRRLRYFIFEWEETTKVSYINATNAPTKKTTKAKKKKNVSVRPTYSAIAFQLALYVFMVGAGHDVDPEVMRNSDRADLVVLGRAATFIFETKLEQNRDNPLDQCRDKYVNKFLHLQKLVICIGLRFSQDVQVVAWGVAEFSSEGKLSRQVGDIRMPKKRKMAVSRTTTS